MNQAAKVVLVGSGRMGQIRAAALYANPRFDFLGAVDGDLEGAKKLAIRYKTLPFKSFSQAISHFSANHTSIDGVVISTPTCAHEAIIKEAALNGLAIFTEKPVDETAEKIELCFNLCRDANVELCCGFQRRFCPSYVANALAIQSGKIGKPLIGTIFFADHPMPPLEFLLQGSDIFSDLSCHDVDYIRWALQDDVANVYATGTSSTRVLEEAGIHDNATIVMKFRKGAVVTLNLSRSACYGYDQRVEIFGEEGLATVGNEYDNTSTLSNRDGVHQSKLKHSFPQRFHLAFQAELDAFADTILLKKAWPVTAEDCIAVQKVSDAARESCKKSIVVEI